MNQDNYHQERIKLQRLQSKLQFTQVLIQAVTLIATLILLGNKLYGNRHSFIHITYIKYDTYARS